MGKYYIFISQIHTNMLLDVFFTELYGKVRKRLRYKKNYIEGFVWETTFLAACAPSYVILCCFFSLLQFYVEKNIFCFRKWLGWSWVVTPFLQVSSVLKKKRSKIRFCKRFWKHKHKQDLQEQKIHLIKHEFKYNNSYT